MACRMHACLTQWASKLAQMRTARPQLSSPGLFEYKCLAVRPSPARGVPVARHATAAGTAAQPLTSEVCSLRADVLDVPGPLADDLSDLLMAEGASSTSVEEFRPEGAPEQEIYAHEVAAAAGLELRLWARCTVIAHFPPEADVEGAVAAAKGCLSLSSLQHSVAPQRTRDWEAAIRESYQPVEVTPGLWVVPSWAQQLPIATGPTATTTTTTSTSATILPTTSPSTTASSLPRILPSTGDDCTISGTTTTTPSSSAAHDHMSGIPAATTTTSTRSTLSGVDAHSDSDKPASSCNVDPSHPTSIVLEPGLAFGTGDHPTTRLCLRWLAGVGSLPGAAVMDYGTGSGVLAVGALVMGAARAVGTDVEPLAVRAAHQNAQLNGVEGRLTAVVCAADIAAPEPVAAAGHGAQEGTYDLVVANILQGPLTALAPRLAAYCRPGGVLGLSGILERQVAEVQAAYSPFFEHFEVATEESCCACWALLTARRRDGGVP